MKHHRFMPAFYLLVSVIVSDQLTKWWIVNKIMQPPRVVPLTSFCNFVLVWNKGVTFGLLSQFDHRIIKWLLIAVAAVILFLLGRWLLRTHSTLIALALGCVMGGAVSNVIDRLRFGAVVDFLDFYYNNYHWYAFNVADAAIFSGLSLLMLDSLIRGR
jgi:signal peptidase II